MFKSLTALAILGATTAPAAAQTAPAPGSAATNQAQPAAKPQMVKKLICEESDNPYSRIGRVCHSVMVPAQPQGAARNDQAQTAPNAPAGS